MKNFVHESAEELKKKYEAMNGAAKKGGVVFFGSDVFCNMPVAELAKGLQVEEEVYNRSVPGMRIGEAPELLSSCVLQLMPAKVFIEIDCRGEEINDYIAGYEWLLYSIHNKTKAKCYIVFRWKGDAISKEVGRRLLLLACESGCELIDITKSEEGELGQIKVFEQLRFFMRTHRPDFFEAMRRVKIS